MVYGSFPPVHALVKKCKHQNVGMQIRWLKVPFLSVHNVSRQLLMHRTHMPPVDPSVVGQHLSLSGMRHIVSSPRLAMNSILTPVY